MWFDALPNYLTATGFPGPDYTKRWPAQLHVIGKDITRFHCVIWPAMLRAAELPLPDRVWAHGFVTLGGGERFSKSAGVRVELRRPSSDSVRTRFAIHAAGSAVRWRRCVLVGAIQRTIHCRPRKRVRQPGEPTVAMVERYCGGIVPPGLPNEIDEANAVDYRRYMMLWAAPRLPAAQGAPKHVWADRRAGQRIRRPAGALEARQRPGGAASARRRYWRLLSANSCARPFTSRPSCPVGPKSCGAN